MKRITTHVAAVTLFCLCAAAASAQTPKELYPEAVEAWKKAGAKVGWYGHNRFGFLRFSEARPKDSAAVPAFLFPNFKPGVIVNLPAPSAPFAVDLSGTVMTDALLKELAVFKNLQNLDLRFTPVTDAGLKELAGLKRLQTLDLDDTKVTDAGLKELAGLQSMRTLGLASTKVTDAGLKELAGFKELRTLILNNTKVTDAGLKELAGLKSLQTLYLTATKVTGAGVKELQKALPGLKIK
jgi:internalin A